MSEPTLLETIMAEVNAGRSVEFRPIEHGPYLDLGLRIIGVNGHGERFARDVVMTKLFLSEQDFTTPDLFVAREIQRQSRYVTRALLEGHP